MKLKNNIVLAAFAAICFSCNSGEGILDTDVIDYEKTVLLTNDKNAPTCEIKLSLNEMKGEANAVKAINNTITSKLFGITNMPMKAAADSFARQYASEYIRNMRPLYLKDKTDSNKRAWYMYRYNLTTKIKDGKDNCLVYSVFTDYYEGGTHGVSQHLVYNFSRDTGKMLTLDDIFVPGYKSRLNDILLKALIEDKNVKTLSQLKEKGYLYGVDIFTPENFIIGDDGITFIYNIYEIAPYSEGKTTLTISYPEVNDLLKRKQ